MYAIKRGKRNVVHLADGEFRPPLCGRAADLTSNVPWGKRLCRDCQRIAATTTVVRVRDSSGSGSDRG